MGSSVLTNAVATLVSEFSPSKNHDAVTRLILQLSGPEYISYIYWARPFPLGATILSAKIYFYTFTMSTGVTFTFQRLNQSFSASKVTYNTRPTSLISGTKTVVITGAQVDGAVWELDVTDWMQTISNGGKWYGLRITGSTTVSARYIHSENATNAAYRPRLEVTWSDAPDTPSGLSPSGGRAVGLNKPIVKAVYRDVSGSTVLANAQVQLNTTDSWPAVAPGPVFDTGIVATSVPEVNLALPYIHTVSATTTNTSTNITAAAGTFETADIGQPITGTGIQAATTITAVAAGGASATLSLAANASGTNTMTITRTYAGLADGSTIFWRIRLQDAAGVWSAWSASTSFKRDDKGALTVNNPPVGTPVVEDATPPISWTFTSETQAAYQVQIRHTVNAVQVVDWDSGKVTSSATSVTVPAGKINEPTNTTYTVTVRIWDTKQREATPGDPTYVEVVRNFTFVPGATTGTTALNAVADAIRPKVVLTWTAATFPDRFNILRNNKVIAAALDPNDTFVSGTTHTYTDRSPSPGRTLTYAVQRVVNNVASASNSTDVETVNSKGIWLQEPASGLELCIMGLEGRDFALGEQGAALQAIAPHSNKVAINQTLGGLEGRIEGELVSIYGKTAQEWRDQYLQIRALRIKKFWVTVGDFTFEAVCQGFSYSQKSVPEIVFRVGFDVYQQNSVSTALLGS